ncbi:MAG: biotin/lipoyl-binding protein, partial [Pseudomonadota bacterium]
MKDHDETGEPDRTASDTDPAAEAGTAAGGDDAPTERKGELASLRRITLGAIAVVVVIFVYSVIADRMTPFAADARAQAFVLRVATELSGRVEAVGVSDNTVVEAGAELFRIDPTPFEIAVDQARARLDQAGQNVNASTSSIEVAEAKVAEARAQEANVRAQSARVLELVARGVYAKAREDDANAAIDEARASVVSAEADLARAQRRDAQKRGAVAGVPASVHRGPRFDPLADASGDERRERQGQ